MTIPPADVLAPTSRQLVRSSIIAVLVATLILVTCVLPAEYGVDLTGVGRILGLTQMGEVKRALAEEAANNAAAEASADSVIAASEAAAPSSTVSDTGAAIRADGVGIPLSTDTGRLDKPRRP